MTALSIFVLSSFSLNAVHPVKYLFADKIIHFIIYFIFTGTILIATIENLKDKSKNFIVLITFIIAAIYAASDEFHQLFVPNRNCDFYDYLADLIGIIFSLFVYNSWRKLSKTIVNLMLNESNYD